MWHTRDLDIAFSDARRRVTVVFWLNIALSLLIALVLVGAITAAIVFGFLGQSAWVTALGGVAVLDLVSAAVYRPLTQVNQALLTCQRLDIVYLSARERLKMASELPDAYIQMIVAGRVWTDVNALLQSLR